MGILQEKKDKNKSLNMVLIELAKDAGRDLLKTDNAKKKYIQKLEQIYSNLSNNTKYKHSYADIFNVLSMIKSEKSLEMNLDILASNLSRIYAYVMESNSYKDKVELQENIERLYNHVNLDIARLNYVEGRYEDDNITRKQIEIFKKELRKSEKLMRNINRRMNNHDTAMNELSEKISNHDEKIDKYQTEQVTVLSIFTAVVLSFVGGMAFSTSALENIHKTDMYRLLFVMIILGLVLVNVIWGLLAIIKYINKNIEACSKPFKIINAILIILLALNMLAYKKDVFEAENKMNAQLSSETNGAVNITNSNIDNEESLKENTKTSETEESEETESTKKSKEKTDTKTTKK